MGTFVRIEWRCSRRRHILFFGSSEEQEDGIVTSVSTCMVHPADYILGCARPLCGYILMHCIKLRVLLRESTYAR